MNRSAPGASRSTRTCRRSRTESLNQCPLSEATSFGKPSTAATTAVTRASRSRSFGIPGGGGTGSSSSSPGTSSSSPSFRLAPPASASSARAIGSCGFATRIFHHPPSRSVSSTARTAGPSTAIRWDPLAHRVRNALHPPSGGSCFVSPDLTPTPTLLRYQ